MYNLSSITEPGVNLDFHLWQGHPQEPAWKNESVVRLGGSEASTQVTRKISDPQTSIVWFYSDNFDIIKAKYRACLELPRKGRLKFTGENGEVVEGIIVQMLNYNWTRGKYSYSGSSYDYALTVTITYIVDQKEE